MLIINEISQSYIARPWLIKSYEKTKELLRLIR